MGYLTCDHGLTFDGLRRVNVTRCARWHPPGSVPWVGTDWITAMVGEFGEAANIVKKIRRQETGARNEGDPPLEELRVKLAHEIADTVIYADLLAAHYGINLEEAVVEKFNKKSEQYGFPERL